MKKEIKILTREDSNSHPIIKRVIEVLIYEGYDVTVCKRRGMFSSNSKYITFDPLYGALLAILRVDFILYSLEMFEHQVSNRTFRNRVRNLIFGFSHRLAMKHSRLTVFCNELRSSHYIRSGWVESDNCLVVRNYPQQSFLDYMQINNGSRLSSADGIRRFVYAGSIQPGRDIEVVLSSFAVANKSVLLIAGRDSSNLFKNKSYKNVTYLGELDQARVCELLIECDYGILEYENNILNTKYCAPMKVYEYYAAGLKIVCNQNFSMGQLLGGFGITDYRQFEPDTFIVEKQKIEISSFENELINVLLPKL